ASFLYIVMSVAILAASSPWGRGGRIDLSWVLGGRAVFLGLSCVVGLLPLRSGLSRLAKFEL
ncbi:MAG: hypothetical protein QHJ82_07655, partial [Verrucomicrobiota bacterium]|nr:hypothetical protein [Verrucomicrobiota bacterium]